MGLFKPDLYRSFAVGFVLGAALLSGFMAAKSGDGLSDKVIPAATAAPALPDQTLVAAAVDRTR
ncbi:MAG: hypothetical protein J0M19_03120 [Sphingomonadales bacterium]|nr:hypothetical protein [Sphingomonadales bacterium]